MQTIHIIPQAFHSDEMSDCISFKPAYCIDSDSFRDATTLIHAYLNTATLTGALIIMGTRRVSVVPDDWKFPSDGLDNALHILFHGRPIRD